MHACRSTLEDPTTKSIAAGVFLLPAIALIFGLQASGSFSPRALISGITLSLVFQAITSVLLVADLKRPDRFLYILLRPQWKSWLAIGAYILVAFGVVSGLCWVAELLSFHDLAYILAIPGCLLAVMAAIYSGLLFAQAEGRDFWQSRLTTPHLLAQAIIAGAALFGSISIFSPLLPISYIQTALCIGLIPHLVMMLAHLKTSSGDTRRASALLTKGPLKGLFWGMAVASGTALPLLMMVSDSPVVLTVASVLALGGLLAYEALWIIVGQAVPLS